MSFASLDFLTLFFPAALLLGVSVRSVPWRNAALTALSLAFYAVGDPRFLPLLIGCALLDYGLGRYAARAKRKTLPVLIAAAIHIALLGVFKYAGFFTDTLNAVARLSLPVPAIALPIGISFITFQGMSYVFDVARGECAPEKNVVKLLLYISFFPQLVAGPIVRYADFGTQADMRRISADRMAKGLRRMIVGLSKKVLLADTLGRIADAAFSGAPGASLAWLGAISFMMQLYLDFSGYADMALGMGDMLGFSLPENFRAPYRANSITDFWRRWHITLTDWFRQYVYIPLGGNKRGTLRTCLNLLLVFALTGLWHGASWSFVCWGLFNGLLVVLERLHVLRPERLPRLIRHGYVLLLTLIGFVLFRADTLPEAMRYFTDMLGRSGLGIGKAALCLSPKNLCCLLVSLPVCLDLRLPLKGRLGGALRAAAALCLLAACLLSIAASDYHPFLYFRF